MGPLGVLSEPHFQGSVTCLFGKDLGSIPSTTATSNLKILTRAEGLGLWSSLTKQEEA